MLVKLVYKDRTTIFSKVDSVSLMYEEGKDKILSVVFKDETPKLNFILSERTENSEVMICEAYLMNEKGETIERLN